jgi:hypothetical protein
MGKHSSANKRKARIQKVDSDGLSRYKVAYTYAFQRVWTVKAINEQQAIQRIDEGFGRSAGNTNPEVVDIAAVNMSTAEAKGYVDKDGEGEGLIEVVTG